ncbi:MULTISPECIES: hypothetical protein [Bacillota]|jgi:hypothetical protein|uniref:VCBS repeat-containing protein n=2 Tax=Amedibacillus TaxID=2749846 RepID=A0A7G9GR90_9FIRM|nr:MULTISPECIES: hypothetical protein [Bacillota]QNM13322.1 hypothetical protein H9Q80_05055 [[Eubacterium] hominis]MCH4285531.1 hypothetical protein [Amedibacillus hominis]RGB50388.1 hypothetical protein DW271_16615 [Absiella sp. AM22-9]RGB58712.1 hypothetical protein DW120_13235 [Absiella sp. AM10-20]RHU05722.1 hypothetical protein DW716_12735 [Absiella sp. AM27-20]
MKIEKIHLDDVKRCYCASNINMNNENHILFASEDPDVICEMFSGKNFDKKEVVWTKPGGCMSIIPIPGKEGEFLAVQEFYLKVSPSLAKIVWGKYDAEKGWIVKDVLSMPYIHRFDIYHADGVNYFIGATIATTKQDKNDWSVPGRIYTGILPEDPSQGIELSILADGLYRNHGYWHAKEDGKDVGYFGSDQGILRVTPPYEKGGEWTKEFIMEGQIGEIATIDIDNDGEDEIMTIEAFHGDTIKIYKKIDGAYKEVYKYDNKIDFAHTLVGAKLAGVNTFLAGVRREEAEIFYVQYVDGKFVTTVIEKGAGPANLCVVNEDDRDLIVAANHTKNEAAVYVVTK